MKVIGLIGGIDVDIPASFSADYPANDDPTIDPQRGTALRQDFAGA